MSLTATSTPPRATVQWSGTARHNAQALARACPGKNVVLYGVIDAAVDDSLYAQLMAEPPSSQVTCLFEGAPAIRYRNVAPYLMVLNPQSPLAALWLDHAWVQHWGIWMCSAQPLELLKAHLKKFLFVKTATSAKAYFRYYDPRVLQQVMPIMSYLQRGSLFGLDHKPMPDAFLSVRHEKDHSPVLLRYRPSQGRLMRLASIGGLETDHWPWQ